MKTSFMQALFIAGDTLRSMAKRKRALLGILVIPLVFAAFFSYGLHFLFTQGLFIDGFSVAIYQEDHHPMAGFLVEQIQRDEELGTLITLNTVDSEKEVGEMVEKGLAFAGVVIPEDYVGSLERGESQELILYTNPEDPLKNHLLLGVMESFMYSVSAGQSGVNAVWNYYREEGYSLEERQEKIQPIIQDLTLRALQARERMVESDRIEGVNSLAPGVYYLHSMMMAMALFIGVFSGKQMIEEREMGILKGVEISPVSFSHYELGRSMGYTLGITIFAMILFLITIPFTQQTLRGIFLMGLWYGLFFYGILQCARLIAYGFKDHALFAQWGNIVVFAGVIFGGGIIPFYYMPDQFAWIPRIFPHYYYFTGLENLLFPRNGMIIRSFLILGIINILLTVLKSMIMALMNRRGAFGKEGFNGLL